MADRAVTDRRPLVLVGAQLLWFAAALPFLGLAVLTNLGTPERKQQVAAELPRLVVGALDHRAVGVLLWVAAVTFLLSAVFVGPGRRWARTAAVTFTGLYDAALVMLLLGDTPRPGGWLVGGAVVLASLAAVVLSYQPPVERYLVGPGDPLRSTA
jgi:hypothetical protein